MTHAKRIAHIILIFATAMIFSYFGDSIREVLGDWHCEGNNAVKSSCMYVQIWHDAQWHWGWRHWLFMFMGPCLFAYHVYLFVLTFNKENK